MTGQNITNSGGTAFAFVSQVVLTSGSYMGNDAAGYLIVTDRNSVAFDTINLVGPPRTFGAFVTTGPTSATQDLTDYVIIARRVYRINQTASGSAQYQLVAELPIATVTGTDTMKNAILGPVLPSLEWDGPPSGIAGLISLPNGVFAAFVDNRVCFSVPYYPHAWPASYQKAVDSTVVGLGHYGNSVITLTQGKPYVIVGNDPSNLVMEKIEGLACLYKKSIVVGDQLTLYASPQGLSAVGPGMGKLLTSDIITQQDWQANYGATSIIAFYWESKYVAFIPTWSGGFMYEPAKNDVILLDSVATAGCYDSVDGTLWIVIGSNIYKFVNDTANYRSMDYKTKVYRYQSTVFNSVKVVAAAYPVTISVYYPESATTSTVIVTSNKPVRIPQTRSTMCSIRIQGPETSAVFIASSFAEIPV